MAKLTAEQIAEARREGYSDAEILNHFASLQGVDLNAARNEGYSDAEILSHFSGADVEPQTQQAVAPANNMLTNPAMSGALGAGAGAAYSAKTLPVKAAKTFGSAIGNRIAGAPIPAPTAAPSPSTYTTPAGINVEQTPGGLHPGAVGNAQFNIEQQQANQLRQNMPSGFEQRGTSRIITPMGMQEPTPPAALGGGTPSTQSMSTVNRLRKEGWPIVRETAAQAAKTAAPVIGGAARNILTSSPAAGAMAGYNLQDALNRYREGDVAGATIGGIGAGSQLLPRKGKAGLIKAGLGLGAAGINALRGKPDGYADGRRVVESGLKALREAFTPKQSVETRLSDALSNDIGKWYRPTQADRMRSIEGDLGGIGFSKFQHEKPEYAAAKSAWGVMNPTAATRIANLNAEKGVGNTIWTPMIGSPKQHHSNQHVHDTLVEEFNRQASLGKLTPELRDALNQRAMTYVNRKTGNPIFSEGIDFGNPEQLAKIGTTFEKRAAMGELFGGTGVGGRKGSIIPYEDIMTEYMDEATRGVPTHSLGNRLFTLTGEHSYRPDLHSAFPQNLAGEDRAVILKDLPSFEVGMPDWNRKFLETHGGRAPGFFDKTLGSKKIGYPIQEITEPYLESLYKAGYAEGGNVETKKGGLAALAKKALKKYGVGIGLTAPFAAEAGQQMAHGDVQGGMGSAMDLASGFLPPPAMAAYMGLAPSETAPMHMDQYPGRQGTNPLAGSGSVMENYTPHMAGGGDILKALKKIMGESEGVGMRTIEGSPHTYPPIAEGQWMRDYQPATNAAGLPTTREGWDALGEQTRMAQIRAEQELGRTGPNQSSGIQYMGKYRQGTPEERAAQRQSDNDTIRMLMKLRGLD